MPAYYITSGDLNAKISAETPYEACLIAFKQQIPPALKDKIIHKLNPITIINEKGPEVVDINTSMALTAKILRETGMEKNYTITAEHENAIDRVINDIAAEVEEKRRAENSDANEEEEWEEDWQEEDWREDFQDDWWEDDPEDDLYFR